MRVTREGVGGQEKEVGFCYKHDREGDVGRRFKGQEDKEILRLDGDDREDFRITLVMEGLETEFLIDTGADVTVITERTAGRIGGRVRQSRRELFGAGGKKLGVLGVKEIEIEDQNGGKVRAEVTIIKGAKNNLLGKPEINSLKLLKRVYCVEIQKKFPRLYRELGQLPDTFEIKL